jgi:hypothetical protein
MEESGLTLMSWPSLHHFLWENLSSLSHVVTGFMGCYSGGRPGSPVVHLCSGMFLTIIYNCSTYYIIYIFVAGLFVFTQIPCVFVAVQ